MSKLRATRLRILGLFLAAVASLPRILAAAPPVSGPEAIVQAQFDAYNAHDIDAFVAAYAEDAQLFEHPAKLLASGSAQLRERYAARLKEPGLRAVLVRRIVMGNVVV